MKKISPQKRKIILTLMLVSGVCTAISKKLAGDYSGFVFPLPLPGWGFLVNRFYRREFIHGDVITKNGLKLRNVIDVKTWTMPPEWNEDIERLKGKMK